MTIEEVAQIITDYTGVTVDQMRSGNRKREIIYAMHMAMWMVKTYTADENPAIGKFFNRDRTTVIHGIKKIQGFVDVKDEETLFLIGKFTEQIKQAA